jgi:hypothetical protein
VPQKDLNGLEIIYRKDALSRMLDLHQNTHSKSNSKSRIAKKREKTKRKFPKLPKRNHHTGGILRRREYISGESWGLGGRGAI